MILKSTWILLRNSKRKVILYPLRSFYKDLHILDDFFLQKEIIAYASIYKDLMFFDN